MYRAISFGPSSETGDPEHLLTGKVEESVAFALWQQHHLQVAGAGKGSGTPFQHRTNNAQDVGLWW